MCERKINWFPLAHVPTSFGPIAQACTWAGIELATFCSAVWCPTNWAIPVSAQDIFMFWFFYLTFSCSPYFPNHKNYRLPPPLLTLLPVVFFLCLIWSFLFHVWKLFSSLIVFSCLLTIWGSDILQMRVPGILPGTIPVSLDFSPETDRCPSCLGTIAWLIGLWN